jgi:hypothetical protein
VKLTVRNLFYLEFYEGVLFALWPKSKSKYCIINQLLHRMFNTYGSRYSIYSSVLYATKITTFITESVTGHIDHPVCLVLIRIWGLLLELCPAAKRTLLRPKFMLELGVSPLYDA